MIKNTSFFLNKWVEYFLFGLGFTMTVTVAVQVFFRYILNHSLFWSEELARFLLVWLTFLGASCAYYRNLNPGVDFLYEKLSLKFQKISTVLTHLCSMGLFIIMIIFGIIRLQISPALQMPKWIILSIIPISGVILTIHAVNFLLEELKKADS